MNIEALVVYIITGGIAIIAVVAVAMACYLSNFIIKIGEKMGIDPYDSEMNVRYSNHQDDTYLK
ncbi:MAG TPA: hypothetical protein VFW07_26380 [Parafilimonas sp.]|nr:hypothetical protein [Parafilimonas sp.]